MFGMHKRSLTGVPVYLALWAACPAKPAGISSPSTPNIVKAGYSLEALLHSFILITPSCILYLHVYYTLGTKNCYLVGGDKIPWQWYLSPRVKAT